MRPIHCFLGIYRIGKKWRNITNIKILLKESLILADESKWLQHFIFHIYLDLKKTCPVKSSTGAVWINSCYKTKNLSKHFY
jgi:hypothetical protein